MVASTDNSFSRSSRRIDNINARFSARAVYLRVVLEIDAKTQ